MSPFCLWKRFSTCYVVIFISAKTKNENINAFKECKQEGRQDSGQTSHGQCINSGRAGFHDVLEQGLRSL